MIRTPDELARECAEAFEFHGVRLAPAMIELLTPRIARYICAGIVLERTEIEKALVIELNRHRRVAQRIRDGKAPDGLRYKHGGAETVSAEAAGIRMAVNIVRGRAR